MVWHDNKTPQGYSYQGLKAMNLLVVPVPNALPTLTIADKGALASIPPFTTLFIWDGAAWHSPGGGAVYLDDLILTVDGGEEFDPPNGVSTLNLPPEWSGKRFRVYRNGTFFTNYTKDTDSITFSLDGDVTQTDEQFAFSNY